MFVLKPAFWTIAAALAAAIPAPAFAQQTQPNDAPAATQAPNTGRGGDDRGRPGRRWGDEGRSYNDQDDRWDRRSYGERRYGRDGSDYDQRWRGGPRDGRMMQQRGMMMGHHGMMGSPFDMRLLCGPEGERIADIMLGRLERITQPTAEQRPAFDKLKDGVAKASEIVRAACSTERPITPPGRLAAAEKRLTALLEAVRMVRPAMDEYYRSLSDEQKARLYLAQLGRWHEGPRGGNEERGGRWGGRDRYGDQNRGDDRTRQGADDDEMESEHL
jgi:hypothetical protein